jgi:hypothetical protein
MSNTQMPESSPVAMPMLKSRERHQPLMVFGSVVARLRLSAIAGNLPRSMHGKMRKPLAASSSAAIPSGVMLALPARNHHRGRRAVD